METKFTSGPYRAEGPDMFGDWNILHPADALAVAAVVSNMRPSEEVAANANLFSASAELYEALWLLYYGGGYDDPEACRKAEDALEKAARTQEPRCDS